MKSWKVIAGLMLLVLLSSTALPVHAASNTADLPPLPEWPIIGPLLKWLGLVESEPAEVTEPPEDLELPQYPIETLDDLLALQDLESNVRVRVTATDTALTTIVQDALAENNVEGIQNFKLTFTPGTATVYVEVDPAVLENVNFDLPINLKDTLKLEGVVNLGAAGCQATVTIKKVSINNWSIGLRGIAQRWIDEQLPGVWPGAVCVERITLKSGEIAVVGYRR